MRAEAVQVARVAVHHLIAAASAGQLVFGVLGVEPLVGDVAVLKRRVLRLRAAPVQSLVLLHGKQHQPCSKRWLTTNR
jgi:hypothetical protein